MSLFPCVQTLLQPVTSVGKFSAGLLALWAGSGLLTGHGSVATAMPATAILCFEEQEESEVELVLKELIANSPDEVEVAVELKELIADSADEMEVAVELKELIADSAGEIEVAVTKEIDGQDEERVKKFMLKNLSGDQEASADGEVEFEVVVVADGDSEGQKAILKKHKGHLHEVIAGDDLKFEVIVMADDGSKKHKVLRKHKSLKSSDGPKHDGDSDGHKTFMFKVDGSDDVTLDLHEHLGEMIHAGDSDKFSRRSIANKLRQLADQLEGKHGKHHSVHPAHRKIEWHPAGVHKFHIKEGNNRNPGHPKKVELKTGSGKKIFIGKPESVKNITVDVSPEKDGKHGKHREKKFILHGDVSDAKGNLFLEKILDSDHASDDLAEKIMGKVKKRLHQHNVVVDTAVEENVKKKATPKKKATSKARTFEWKHSPKGVDASIQELRKELEELRRELKELRSDRKKV